MPDFNAKMLRNRFRLGLCPRPRWGSLQRSPDSLAGFKGPTFKGREERGGEERDGRRGEGRLREGTGHSTCLPPRFDNPGYGPDNTKLSAV